ncbi:MAG: (2Fe-2S)-binding protein [Sphaerochaetaceae bacterium]|jgi:xanthine dehydrogenase iron-sulfur-binding subunit|nr:(2Fe-2S)-binding protein [Sphaerochaetaceae bacterium]MDD3163283.1 (2Fe-2S)-binding protein [Sphaerochaetaceae bacterium]MDD4006847.1 (2Fe-2S)-binding protein [Sphaerochaetaceae bacterium]MDD4395977.1 (2Fe-2S)-binding protein [Sphaerochaetaceae bacterium]
MDKQKITFTLNHEKREEYIDPRASLSEVLRGEFSLTSVKHGCNVGECGACTVLIDGETFNSCIYLAIWADGKDVLTLEGLSDVNGNISDIQQAFIDEGAIQCGFCTPGFIMSSLPIIESPRTFTRDEIRKQISGNFCRCTGYETIVNAIEKTANSRHKAK